jgi:ABC-2 type transport system ATP-binding protein
MVLQDLLYHLGQDSPNQLLQKLMPFGEVVGFQEILPSMEEIFIQQVKEYSDG